MAQKMITIKGIVQEELRPHDRPHDLSDKDVKALGEGKEINLEALPKLQAEGARPHDLSDKDVEALRAGKEINLEALPKLQAVEGPEEGASPHDLSDKDVEGLRAGKEVDLGKRARLKKQG
jgi:hypothetical protein